MKEKILFLLIFKFGLCLNISAQSLNNTPDTIRVIALADVEVTSSSSHLAVSSGTEDNNTFHIISPGGGYAVRFFAPKSNFHELRQVRLHFHKTSKIKEGRIRIRLTSTAAGGSPSNDTLLAPILVNTLDLQRAQHHLTLQWSAQQLVVPERGFFIVVEGVGQTEDEFVSGIQVLEGSKRPLQYKISNRNQLGSVVRTTNADNFPKIKGTKPKSDSAESWYRDSVTQQWHLSSAGRSVLLVEALFE